MQIRFFLFAKERNAIKDIRNITIIWKHVSKLDKIKEKNLGEASIGLQNWSTGTRVGVVAGNKTENVKVA